MQYNIAAAQAGEGVTAWLISPFQRDSRTLVERMEIPGSIKLPEAAGFYRRSEKIIKIER